MKAVRCGLFVCLLTDRVPGFASCFACRSGKLCARYVKAELPLPDLQCAMTLLVVKGSAVPFSAAHLGSAETATACRSGKLCARYVKADLPLLDLQSKAGLNSVLGLGISLVVLGAAALVAVAFIAMRMRRRARYKRAPVAAAPGCAARASCSQIPCRVPHTQNMRCRSRDKRAPVTARVRCSCKHNPILRRVLYNCTTLNFKFQS